MIDIELTNAASRLSEIERELGLRAWRRSQLATAG